MNAAEKLAREIWVHGNPKIDISEFNIPLSSAVSMMEMFTEQILAEISELKQRISELEKLI